MSELPSIPSIMYKHAQNKPNKVINHISPSMVGRCMRTHFYAIKHIEQTTVPNAGALLNFQVGFLWEKIVEEALDDAHIPFIKQYKMHDEELGVEGTLDFAPYNTVEGFWEVWDSKTESDKAMSRRDRSKVDYLVDHPEYLHQLNTYCILLRNQGFNVKRGRFGVISKDNGRIQESITEFPESSLKATLERILELKGYIERDEIPPCECHTWHITYCNYGRPSTQTRSKTKKVGNSECCGLPEEIEKWSKEEFKILEDAKND